MKKIFLLITVLIISTNIAAQNIVVNKIEPPNWWAGMKTNKIQLMIYGKNLNNISAGFKDKNIKVVRVNKIANPDYAFIDVEIKNDIKPNDYELTLSRGKEKTSVKFPIHKRENDKKRFQGFSPDDIIYLIMPDRFVNGDPSNDSIP